MSICPNKNSKEWQVLVEAIGARQAYIQFLLNSGEIPAIIDIDQVKTSLKTIDNVVQGRRQGILLPGLRGISQEESNIRKQAYSIRGEQNNDSQSNIQSSIRGAEEVTSVNENKTGGQSRTYVNMARGLYSDSNDTLAIPSDRGSSSVLQGDVQESQSEEKEVGNISHRHREGARC